MTETISLDDFAKLTGLSDAALGRLLRKKQLPCMISNEGELVISLKHASLDSVLQGVLNADIASMQTRRVQLKERMRNRLLSLWDELEQEIAQSTQDSEHE